MNAPQQGPGPGSIAPLETFAEEARRFLDEHAQRRPPDEPLRWGQGPDIVGNTEERSPEQELEWVRAAKEWKATEFDAGFGWLMGPACYGGRDLTADHERLYRDLRSAYEVPDLGPFTISLGMVAPTILAHATEEARTRYLRRLYRGDLIACQLFSEPGAGSDLAAVSTRAVQDGDEWVLNGQKVWTTVAHHSDIGEVLCRTDPTAPKHKGLTAFVVDMKAPGVDVRPLRQMTGGSSFNEVFFTAVRVPDSHRLGDLHGGWGVALTTLMSERALGAGGDVFGVQDALHRLVLLAQVTGKSRDPLVRQRLAEVYCLARTIRFNGLRADLRRKAGQPPGPEESIFKLSNTNALQRMAAVATEILGQALTADTGEWGTYSWARFVLSVPGNRIAAGTDEIMRNILGERVLGLPKEPVA